MRKPPAADNDPISLIPPGYCHYGQKSGFPDSYRRILPLTTGRNPVSLIPAVGFCLSLRVKMAELYFLPYKATKIYGTGTEISFLGRSKLSISAGQHAILLISVVEAPKKRFLFPGLSMNRTRLAIPGCAQRCCLSPLSCQTVPVPCPFFLLAPPPPAC